MGNEDQICALCGGRSQLQLSHILPAFIWRWMRATSATGHVRVGRQPNRRVQDGLKVPLLCRVCEQRFAAWEKVFAEKVFVPIHEGKNEPIPYEKWLIQFAVSVSWRVATYFDRLDGLARFPEGQVSAARKAIHVWGEFLRGEREHPGRHEQHILILDVIESSTDPNMPPNINRYLTRTIDIDVAHAKVQSIVYSKMMRILLVGFLHVPRPRTWVNTKVNLKHGSIGGKKSYEIPGKIGEFINSKAQMSRDMQSKLSDRQKKVIHGDFMNNLDRVAASELFKATEYDVRLFGEDAFADE